MYKDILKDVAPDKTPLLTAMGERGEPTGRIHEWNSTSPLVAGHSAAVDGSDTGDTCSNMDVKLTNASQILEGGAASIKWRAEELIIGGNYQKRESTTDALLRMGSVDSYFTEKNVSLGKGGSITGGGNGNSIITVGESRPLTRDLLIDAVRRRWDNSEGSARLLIVAHNTHFHNMEDLFAETSVGAGVYEQDSVELVSSNQCREDAIYLIDVNNLRLVDYVGPTVFDVADLVGGLLDMIVWYTTLEVTNPNAHFAIYDLA